MAKKPVMISPEEANTITNRTYRQGMVKSPLRGINHVLASAELLGVQWPEETAATTREVYDTLANFPNPQDLEPAGLSWEDFAAQDRNERITEWMHQHRLANDAALGGLHGHLASLAAGRTIHALSTAAPAMLTQVHELAAGLNDDRAFAAATLEHLPEQLRPRAEAIKTLARLVTGLLTLEASEPWDDVVNQWYASTHLLYDWEPADFKDLWLQAGRAEHLMIEDQHSFAAARGITLSTVRSLEELQTRTSRALDHIESHEKQELAATNSHAVEVPRRRL